MIYGFRTNDPSRANTRIEFKGFEISIAMDDGHRGRHLTRTSLIVYKDDRDVTSSLGLGGFGPDGLVDVNGEDLLKVFQAIERLELTSEVQGIVDLAERKLHDLDEPDPLNTVSDRDMHNAFKNS